MMKIALKQAFLLVLLPRFGTSAKSRYYETLSSLQNLENGSLVERVPGVASVTLCSIIASRKVWPTLGCISNQECILSFFQSRPNSNNSGIAKPLECFTSVSDNDCQLENGTFVPEGKFYVACAPYNCVQGKVLPKVLPKSMTCPSAFTMVENAGCIKVFTSGLTWCESRTNCLNENADLYSPTEDPNDITGLRNYLEAMVRVMHPYLP